ncbi:aldolase [Paenibacillus hexagrammi]|uniref:Aldolase n=1 Tax=Paenibacillus hexagrammi TaxID=2908839 RepID=A0ABY3SLM5_9BACL|nr:aldolase [Paenibacillus sp. YPD9-1]UJF34305.1 aldolase [Paenibacillus sp. YPD9-1]
MAENRKYAYQAFGMHLTSDIPLPELLPWDDRKQTADPDLVIEFSDLNSVWNNLSIGGANFIVNDKQFIFKIPEAAIYRIDEGKKILVSPCTEADHDKIRLFLLGTCMGATLMQRNVLPLHGSAVVIDGKAYAFVGESGAGKSTLASAFIKRGYPLLTDDVIAVTVSSENRMAWVHPAYPQQKLWEQSIHQFGMQSEQYSPVYQEQTKYAVPVLSNFVSTAIPLAGVFELTKSDEESVEMLPLHGLERLHTIMRHTYRSSLISKLGLQQWHFSMSTRIVELINMYQMRRSTKKFTAFDLVEQIVQTVMENKEEAVAK